MKKTKAALLVLVCIGGITATGVYAGSQFAEKHFPPNTYLNGYEVGLMTVSETHQILVDSIQEQTFSVIWANGEEEEIPMSSFSWTMEETPSLEELCGAETLTSWITGRDAIKMLYTEYSVSADEEDLMKQIENLNCVQGIGTEEPTEARIELVDGRYEILDSEVGTRVEGDLLCETIVNALKKGRRSVQLAEAGCYVTSLVDRNDEHLRELLSKAEAIESCSIQIDLKGVSETLDWDVFGSWETMDTEGNFTLDEEALRTYVAQLADRYNTYGKERSFVTALGNTTTVGAGKLDCYGFEMDQEGTFQVIFEKLKIGESGEVSAAWLQSGVTHGLLNDFGDAYIEISIADQTMWYVRGGEIVLSTKVVTGLENEERRTPTGVYMILDKKKNYTMTGSYGSAYCNFLIAISHDGICIHDAPWRTEYGGSIYLSNGSHGCINTPYSAMQSLYEAETLYGMPVIVY